MEICILSGKFLNIIWLELNNLESERVDLVGKTP